MRDNLFRRLLLIALSALMLLSAAALPVRAEDDYSEARWSNGSYTATLGGMAGRRLYVYGIVDSLAELPEGANDAALVLKEDEPAGRLDAALYLYRMLGTEPAAVCPFSDVPDAYREAVAWLCETGITKGVGNNLYGIGSITEHQLLVMLSRYFHWETEHPDAVRYLAESIELLPVGPDDGVFTRGDLYQILSAALDRLCPERRIVLRPEMSAPDSILLTAESYVDAVKQIQMALSYVPESVTVQFTTACPEADIDEFLCHFDHPHGGGALPIVGEIDWNFLVPYYLTQYRNQRYRLCLPHYAPASEAAADALDWLRVYRDEAYSAALERFAAEYLDPLKGLPTDYDKARRAHDLLCRLAAYDYAEMMYGTRPQAHSLLGFIESRRVVCDGYAKTYQWMLRYLSVACYTVTGNTSRGDHAWNKVLLDGAWYNVDVCWDDGADCLYFLRSDSFFEAHDHQFTDGFSDTDYASPTSYQR